MSHPNDSELPVLAVVRDLIFGSKVTAAARLAKVNVKFVRDPNLLIGEAGSKAVVDLNQPGALDAAAQWKQAARRPVIGFVAHTDTETIDRAREAGIDLVLTRGQFAQRLPELLVG